MWTYDYIRFTVACTAASVCQPRLCDATLVCKDNLGVQNTGTLPLATLVGVKHCLPAESLHEGRLLRPVHNSTLAVADGNGG